MYVYCKIEQKVEISLLQSDRKQHTYRPKHALERIRKSVSMREILTTLCFFFLSLGNWFNLPLILNIGCAVSVITAGRNTWAALIGSVAGCVFQWLWGAEPFWWSCIVIACLPMLKGIRWKNTAFLIVVSAAVTFPGIFLYGYLTHFSVQDWILAVLQTVGCSMSVPALVKGFQWITKSKKESQCNDAVLCLILPIFAIISGMAHIRLWHVNIGYSAAVALLLIGSRILSVPVSLGAGFGMGLSFLLSGHGAFWCICLPLSGFLNSFTKHSCRPLGAVLCFTCVIFTTYLLSGQIWKDAVYSCLAGSFVYLFFPQGYTRKVMSFLQNTRLFHHSGNPYLENRLHHLTEALGKLSGALPFIETEFSKDSSFAEELMESLCDGCENMLYCWHEQFEERKREFESIEKKLRETGDISLHPVSCLREQQVENILKHFLKREHENTMQRNKVKYEQEMLITHFDAVNRAVEDSISSGIADAEEEAYFLQQINEVLKATHYPAAALFVKQEAGHFKIGLKKQYPVLSQNNFQDILSHIGTRLQRNIKLSAENEQIMLLDEVPRFQISVGKATACAVSAERKSLSPYAVENGDAVICQCIDNGYSLVALSDGMGHGNGAGKESTKTLELLSICLEAGYSRDQAITVVNGIMLSATGGERFATMDLCLFDLWNGKVTFNKLGAEGSLIVQGQNIRLIEGEALPVGIVEHIMPMEHVLPLSDEDMVIMYSDGVTEALNGEESLAVLLRRYVRLSPQQIADSILQDVLIQSGGLPKDDITIVCIRLEKINKKAYTKRSA